MQKKQITVVFYPDTARIYKGEYSHIGKEPYIVNPKEMPIGVPLHQWEYKSGSIAINRKKLPPSFIPKSFPVPQVIAAPALAVKVDEETKSKVDSLQHTINALNEKVAAIEDRPVLSATVPYIAPPPVVLKQPPQIIVEKHFTEKKISRLQRVYDIAVMTTISCLTHFLLNHMGF